VDRVDARYVACDGRWGAGREGGGRRACVPAVLASRHETLRPSAPPHAARRTGRPRRPLCVAQRPFPSMTTAMWRGRARGSNRGSRVHATAGGTGLPLPGPRCPQARARLQGLQAAAPRPGAPCAHPSAQATHRPGWLLQRGIAAARPPPLLLRARFGDAHRPRL